MLSSAGAYSLALCTYTDKKTSEDRPPCLENPRPEGAESTLTENAAFPFQAEPRHPESSVAGKSAAIDQRKKHPGHAPKESSDTSACIHPRKSSPPWQNGDSLWSVARWSPIIQATEAVPIARGSGAVTVCRIPRKQTGDTRQPRRHLAHGLSQEDC
jgi:hypothetical protein